MWIKWEQTFSWPPPILHVAFKRWRRWSRSLLANTRIITRWALWWKTVHFRIIHISFNAVFLQTTDFSSQTREHLNTLLPRLFINASNLQSSHVSWRQCAINWRNANQNAKQETVWQQITMAKWTINLWSLSWFWSCYLVITSTKTINQRLLVILMRVVLISSFWKKI